MAKEILLYSPIYSYSVEDCINAMEAAKGTDIKLRVNSPGGDPYAGYGVIAKFQEHTNGKTMQVDGQAMSTACYLALCADYVECLDVSTFLFHRAAYPSYIENDKARFTDELKADLIRTNEPLRAMIEAKIGGAKFMAVTGVSLDDVFSLDKRVDVQFDAAKALKMGVVQKVNKITPEKKTEIEALAGQYGIAAFSKPIITAKKEVMTIIELKAQHPDVYAAAKAEGITEAVTAERERISAWTDMAEFDAEYAKKGIESGKAITPVDIKHFTAQAKKTATAAAIIADNAPDVATPNAATTLPKEHAAKLATINESRALIPGSKLMTEAEYKAKFKL